MWRVLAGSGAALSLLVGGCVVFTGGTGGYEAAEAGPLPLGAVCTVATDCQPAACCYEADAAVPTFTCQSSCEQTWQQLCGQASDCGDGGQCLLQLCSATFEGVTKKEEVPTCGTIPSTYCSP